MTNVTTFKSDALIFPQANFLTIDLEDWYRLVIQYFGNKGKTNNIAFERQIDIVLEILSKNKCKATFFCLVGSVYDKPYLIKKIASEGHEIATHGWGHEKICDIGLPSFKQDLQRSIGWLEDTYGEKILGYRAPMFSVAPEQVKEFLDICLESGLSYDSSIFPIKGWRYGIPSARSQPHIVRRLNNKTLVEFPIATNKWMGKDWPIGGGGWWRILPISIIRKAFNSVEKRKEPFMTYFHPYEFDSKPLVASQVVKVTPKVAFMSFSQNLGQQTTSRKLDRILKEKEFITVKKYLSELDLL